MKKTALFLGCALFVAGMIFSCGNNNAEATEEDTTANTEDIICFVMILIQERCN